MAVTRTLSNTFKEKLGKGEVDFSLVTAGAFRVILMSNTFAFDPDTTGGHVTYGDVKASELATGNGYTKLDKALVASTAWAADDVADLVKIEWDSALWTATADSIGPTGAAIVLMYDAGDNGGTGDIGDDSLVVGCVDFGEDYTMENGVSFQLKDLGFSL